MRAILASIAARWCDVETLKAVVGSPFRKRAFACALARALAFECFDIVKTLIDECASNDHYGRLNFWMSEARSLAGRYGSVEMLCLLFDLERGLYHSMCCNPFTRDAIQRTRHNTWRDHRWISTWLHEAAAGNHVHCLGLECAPYARDDVQYMEREERLMRIALAHDSIEFASAVLDNLSRLASPRFGSIVCSTRYGYRDIGPRAALWLLQHPQFDPESPDMLRHVVSRLSAPLRAEGDAVARGRWPALSFTHHTMAP